MIIRLRSRDGLERIQLPDDATVGKLIMSISEQLNIPIEDIRLSREASILSSKQPQQYRDLQDSMASLQKLGFSNGEVVYLLYSGERDVEPAMKKSAFDALPFGKHMTVEEMVAKQTRIERQEEADCKSVSFDRYAANEFQTYVQSALAFSIKRGGILYGSVDEDNKVVVEAIYEPPQQGSATSLVLERHTQEEELADLVASHLCMQKVGWIFTQSSSAPECDSLMTTEEVFQAAQMQQEVGSAGVTALVSLDNSDGATSIHFEAFQVSRQAVQLWKDGWMKPEHNSTSLMRLRNPQEPSNATPVMIGAKDTGEVDNDYFLVPVSILDHSGPLSSSFPIENRLTPQGTPELKEHLNRLAGKSYVERICDFHLLLWLAKQSNFERADIALLADAVRKKQPIMEGYRVIIDSIAGIGL